MRAPTGLLEYFRLYIGKDSSKTGFSGTIFLKFHEILQENSTVSSEWFVRFYEIRFNLENERKQLSFVSFLCYNRMMKKRIYIHFK